jgi:hypothetical protein
VYKSRLTAAHIQYVDRFMELQAAIAKSTQKSRTVAEIVQDLHSWPLRAPRTKPTVYQQNGATFFNITMAAGHRMMPSENPYKWLNNGGPVSVALGGMAITCNIHTGDVRIGCARGIGWAVDAYTRAAPHPHILDGRSPCLGDFLSPFREALDKGEFLMALEILSLFLGQATQSDPAGRRWIRFVGALIHTQYPDFRTPTGSLEHTMGVRTLGNKIFTLGDDGRTLTMADPEPLPGYTPEELEAIFTGKAMPDPYKRGLQWTPDSGVPARLGNYVCIMSSGAPRTYWLAADQRRLGEPLVVYRDRYSPWQSSSSTSTFEVSAPPPLSEQDASQQIRETHDGLSISTGLQRFSNRLTVLAGDNWALPAWITAWDGEIFEHITPGMIVYDTSRDIDRLVYAVSDDAVLFLADETPLSSGVSTGRLIKRPKTALTKGTITSKVRSNMKLVCNNPYTLTTEKYAQIKSSHKMVGMGPMLFTPGQWQIHSANEMPQHLEGRTVVTIMCRNGVTHTSNARDYDWGPCGDATIVAYRIDTLVDEPADDSSTARLSIIEQEILASDPNTEYFITADIAESLTITLPAHVVVV